MSSLPKAFYHVKKKINHPGIPTDEAKLFCHHSIVIKILSQFLRRMNHNTKHISKKHIFP